MDGPCAKSGKRRLEYYDVELEAQLQNAGYSIKKCNLQSEQIKGIYSINVFAMF